MPLVECGRSKTGIPGTPASTLAETFLQACAAFKVDAALLTCAPLQEEGPRPHAAVAPGKHARRCKRRAVRARRQEGCCLHRAGVNRAAVRVYARSRYPASCVDGTDMSAPRCACPDARASHAQVTLQREDGSRTQGVLKRCEGRNPEKSVP
jgi:hypothetical protein